MKIKGKIGVIFLISNRWAAQHGAKTNKTKAWKLDNFGIKTRICVKSTGEKYIKTCGDKESKKNHGINRRLFCRNHVC